MEKYIKPEINVVELEIETTILAGSLPVDQEEDNPDQRAPKFGRYDEWDDYGEL